MSANIDIYTLDAERVGDIALPKGFFSQQAHPQMIKNYAVAVQRNLRQWSASTKGRSEVNHSKQKPHAQKGTGRARQGFLGAPQYKGGGVVFGPKPKFDQHIRINRKERRAAIEYLLGAKQRENHLIALRIDQFLEPKTSRISHFLQHLKWTHRTLFVLPSKERPAAPSSDQSLSQCDWSALSKSARNIQKANTAHLVNLNVVDLLTARYVVIVEPALRELITSKE